MASLVQAEGGRLSDYPKIARVIYNRLAQGIPLQLDSTVLYGLNTYGIIASDAQLTSTSPYNTYRHTGLHAGADRQPGRRGHQGRAASGGRQLDVLRDGESEDRRDPVHLEPGPVPAVTAPNSSTTSARADMADRRRSSARRSRTRCRPCCTGPPTPRSAGRLDLRLRSSATRPACPACIASCDSRWAGLSLTMPLKRAVLPLLDRTEPLAAEVGGVNTVVFCRRAAARLQHRRARHGSGPGRGRGDRPAGRHRPRRGRDGLRRARCPARARRWPPSWSRSVIRPGPATCWLPRAAWAWRSSCALSVPRSATVICWSPPSRPARPIFLPNGSVIPAPAHVPCSTWCTAPGPPRWPPPRPSPASSWSAVSTFFSTRRPARSS